ncbi:NADH dehydrogenase ubiquinone Fe-S protein 4 [Inquilinus limosus]|uniref:NADH dehydrogenase ubiquinone Fe-S protein 4 n=1 Tax=Inquilinus limosus TaxID=171674 RepID=UPI0003F9ACAC|nr:NADH dehydrogenase ubiquinone Fe-S protein 4 [Inquilinus limosus]
MDTLQAYEIQPELPAAVTDLRPDNDNRRVRQADGRTRFPRDAVAHIVRPARSATTSGRAGTREWRLVFDRRTPGRVEPLMGWTAGDDPLPQIELRFPSLQSAVAYAERQGLSYVVHDERRPKAAADTRPAAGPGAIRFDPIPNQAWLVWLHSGYGAAESVSAANDTWWESLRPPSLPAAASPRSSKTAPEDLADAVWTEYLADVATDEGMPENGRPSRLQEIRLALLAAAGSRHQSGQQAA